MSLHKLTAGSGYDYLTRQVAALDATDKGHVGLATYYAERGESPGAWVGSGLVGIDGLDPGMPVTAEQMHALFGLGHHPLAAERVAALDARADDRAPNKTEVRAQHRLAVSLGAPFRVISPDINDYRVEVASRIEAANRARGLPADWPVPPEERAAIRTALATELFLAEHGRPPADARELAAVIAKNTRARTTAVAGFDLTFSPVKSVSTLWALADPSVAAVIEQAHASAVRDALTFIEDHALYTRLGHNGVRQVDVRGLIATAFTHRDSRAGDPDLHTHVAVANKVQTSDGRWRAIDGRVLYAATVATSETYNTALERHLHHALGLRFTERTAPDLAKRPVREVVGIDPRLNDRFSKRRHSVEIRTAELSVAFQATHGRPPSPIETLHLSQQATLETREAKHEPRTLGEQRHTWAREALEVVGTERAVNAMVHGCLRRPVRPGRAITDAQVEALAHRTLTRVESTRATWRRWHLIAEAHRQVRADPTLASLHPTAASPLTQRVAEVAMRRSVDLGAATSAPQPTSPDVGAALRRRDGTSVHHAAGTTLFTSAAVLAAEHRIVAAAGRSGGRTVPGPVVEAVIERSAASPNGVRLNPGQADLVRTMATSDRRLQLAIAPAGAGKTTAMNALATAWSMAGGTVVGLAPSAAAADALGAALDSGSARAAVRPRTDTLAKLVHGIGAADDLSPSIGPQTLVVIDEAGMADTLSLDTAVHFALAKGAVVRLIGDDQQLAAIGAGGVLRDVKAEHGALHLTELVRFSDAAEAAASLAIRDGQTEALGYYLDQHRVHVGDRATTVDEAFDGWAQDRSQGVDALMLAPTRELVAELNRRARQHRLALTANLTGAPTPEAEVTLGDGNVASRGDVLLTRTNDRRLRCSPHDWVKNGDRWQITSVTAVGQLRCRNLRHGRTVTLPPEYVRTSTTLGYACTVHSAQGVTSDSTHGIVTGPETRQLLYTMLTRGRIANHVYLDVAADGDPHSVIRPEMHRPPTAVDVLARILACDGSPISATTARRDAADPRTRLEAAVARYSDTLHVAAEDLLARRTGPDWAERLEQEADQVVPHLSDQPAWPTLRSHLALLDPRAAPVAHLQAVIALGPVDDADDPAALLTWRLAMRSARIPGPLPWLDGPPPHLADDPTWGPYLGELGQLVTSLAHEVADAARGNTARPLWAGDGVHIDPVVRAETEVWRAATGVAPDDRRPTGPPDAHPRGARWQRHLDRRLHGHLRAACSEWMHLLEPLGATVTGDDFTPRLAQRLAALARAGIPARQLLETAAAAGPLPDEHGAAALWWRMARHVSPAVLPGATTHRPESGWPDRLRVVLTEPTVTRLQASPWWPALTSNLSRCVERGWQLHDLLPTPPQEQDATEADPATGPAGADRDPCEELVWRTSIVLDPIPDDADHHPDPEPGPADADTAADLPTEDLSTPQPGPRPEPAPPAPTDGDLSPQLRLAGLTADAERRAWRPPLPTEADIRRGLEWAQEWDTCPVRPGRMLEVNQLALRFYESRFPGSWARPYLASRLLVDLTGDDRFRPGLAPAGWTTLVDHLRRAGVSDDELMLSGVATATRDGRLIDRFRDRLMLPILDPRRPLDVLGFVGRSAPQVDRAYNTAVPRYLNTPTTPLFHKAAQLFGTYPEDDSVLAAPVPVLVEGPLDAMAVTLASADRFVGVATLGTALTGPQAVQLARLAQACGGPPVVATDADDAGRRAAERDFWVLRDTGVLVDTAALPRDTDPAGLLASAGPAALVAALTAARPLHDDLLGRGLRDPDRHHDQLRLIAAVPSARWSGELHRLATTTGRPFEALADDLLALVEGPGARSPARRGSDALPPADRRLARPAIPSPEHAIGGADAALDR